MGPARRAPGGALVALALLCGAPGTAAADVEPIHDSRPLVFVGADRLEWREGPDGGAWLADADLWVGSDRAKLWLKANLEHAPGDGWQEAEAQLLYSRMISRFWDLQMGVRDDPRPRPERAHAVLGVQGLAPQWFEVQAAAFVSAEAEVSARLEAAYDLLLTQRLIARPRLEANAAAGTVDDRPDLAGGLNDVTLELRLRYEVMREVAPYVGISWARQAGATASRVRAAGGEVSETAWVAGVRLWY